MKARTTMCLPLGWQNPCGGSDLRNPVGKLRWSYSRRTVLEQCPRRYYYEYYGARAASEDPNKPLLRVLKSLQNRHERVGTIAHLVISAYFRKARSGEVWTADRLCKWAQDIFRKDRIYSQANPEAISPAEGRFPPVLLHEYYYGWPDALALCSEAEKRLVKAVYAFGTSTHFAGFRSAGAMDGSLIEHRLSVQGLPCQVDGRLDLAFSKEGHGTVADWKLGNSSDGGNDSLQLAVYALWATQHFACEPETITVCKVHLLTDEISYFSATESVFANARARIMQDAERMAALHDYGERGIVKAFTPCVQPDVCRACPFQKVCPEGRTVIDARN